MREKYIRAHTRERERKAYEITFFKPQKVSTLIKTYQYQQTPSSSSYYSLFNIFGGVKCMYILPHNSYVTLFLFQFYQYINFTGMPDMSSRLCQETD